MRVVAAVLAGLCLAAQQARGSLLRSFESNVQQHAFAAQTAVHGAEDKLATPLPIISMADYGRSEPITFLLTKDQGLPAYLLVDVQQGRDEIPMIAESVIHLWLTGTVFDRPTFQEAYIDPLVRKTVVDDSLGSAEKCTPLFEDGSELNLVVNIGSDRFGSGTITKINQLLSRHPNVFSHWNRGVYQKRCVKVIAGGNIGEGDMIMEKTNAGAATTFWGLAMKLPSSYLSDTLWWSSATHTALTAEQWPLVEVPWSDYISEKDSDGNSRDGSVIPPRGYEIQRTAGLLTVKDKHGKSTGQKRVMFYNNPQLGHLAYDSPLWGLAEACEKTMSKQKCFWHDLLNQSGMQAVIAAYNENQLLLAAETATNNDFFKARKAAVEADIAEKKRQAEAAKAAAAEVPVSPSGGTTPSNPSKPADSVTDVSRLVNFNVKPNGGVVNSGGVAPQPRGDVDDPTDPEDEEDPDKPKSATEKAEEDMVEEIPKIERFERCDNIFRYTGPNSCKHALEQGTLYANLRYSAGSDCANSIINDLTKLSKSQTCNAELLGRMQHETTRMMVSTGSCYQPRDFSHVGQAKVNMVRIEALLGTCPQGYTLFNDPLVKWKKLTLPEAEFKAWRKGLKKKQHAKTEEEKAADERMREQRRAAKEAKARLEKEKEEERLRLLEEQRGAEARAAEEARVLKEKADEAARLLKLEQDRLLKEQEEAAAREEEARQLREKEEREEQERQLELKRKADEEERERVRKEEERLRLEELEVRKNGQAVADEAAKTARDKIAAKEKEEEDRRVAQAKAELEARLRLAEQQRILREQQETWEEEQRLQRLREHQKREAEEQARQEELERQRKADEEAAQRLKEEQERQRLKEN